MEGPDDVGMYAFCMGIIITNSRCCLRSDKFGCISSQ